MLVLMRAIPRHSGLPAAAATLMARRLCAATAECVALPQTVTVHPGDEGASLSSVLPFNHISTGSVLQEPGFYLPGHRMAAHTSL